jgi:hypothetical protein
MKKNHFLFYLLFFLFCIFVTGCSKDPFIDEIPKKEDESISTRSIATILCVDAYVNDVFKGTHCWAVYGGGAGPSLPVGAIPGAQYHPDGYPTTQGGSGGNFSQGTQWIFNFKILQGLIGYTSSLNLLEKEKLTHVMQLFIGNNIASVYKTFYNYMLKIGLQLDFRMNSDLNTPASYSVTEKRIEFSSINSINFDSLIEELVHAVQDKDFYGNEMFSTRKNCEFEAKVFIDIVSQIGAYEGKGPAYYKVPMTHTGNDGFADRYISWINEIVYEQFGQFKGNDEFLFRQFCEEWNGYNGTYSSSYVPQLIKAFLNKPIPPQN